MKTLQQIFESILLEDKSKEYSDKLESTLGTDEFDKVHNELKNDSSMTKEHIKSVCTHFWGTKHGSGTIDHSSRNNILRDIYSRHEKLLDSRHASETIGR